MDHQSLGLTPQGATEISLLLLLLMVPFANSPHWQWHYAVVNPVSAVLCSLGLITTLSLSDCSTDHTSRLNMEHWQESVLYFSSASSSCFSYEILLNLSARSLSLWHCHTSQYYLLKSLAQVTFTSATWNNWMLKHESLKSVKGLKKLKWF